MIQIELPCCEATVHMEELAESVSCEACGVVLELDGPSREALPVAA